MINKYESKSMIRASALNEEWCQFCYSRIAKYPDKRWCDATLSLKPFIFRASGSFERLQQNEVSKFNQELFKRLSKQFYKHAYRRYGKELLRVPVIERNKSQRLHVHMLLEIPNCMLDRKTEYCELVENTARQLRWCETSHSAQHMIRPIANQANARKWLEYILKGIRSNSDVVDVSNMRL